jgi:hypothetical protein
MSVHYRVVSSATGSTICVFSDVPANCGDRTEKVLADIASMVATMTPSAAHPADAAQQYENDRLIADDDGQVVPSLSAPAGRS